MDIMVTVTEGGRNFIHHGDEVHFVFAWCVCECVSKGMSEDFSHKLSNFSFFLSYPTDI